VFIKVTGKKAINADVLNAIVLREIKEVAHRPAKH
jgi:hypothetical protein